MPKNIKVVWSSNSNLAGQGLKYAMAPELPIELDKNWINGLNNSEFATLRETFKSISYDQVLEKYYNNDEIIIIGNKAELMTEDV
ncbi:hypothetical protein [Rickettsia endosymbiont of Gonocerus acuteangulatus]|uniref:hypothetical protein n=1 Tax=Rickettsia endosymbiont of Gonocerus acuteangulatus TaxID=3066266 RepID=UPI0031331D02